MVTICYHILRPVNVEDVIRFNKIAIQGKGPHAGLKKIMI